MSQRNPMNERYQNDEHLGKTRKSAAAAKPKAKAAASVRVQSAKKTPEQKKAAQKAARKAERAKQAELDRKYYNPPTAQYKKLKRLWWASLVGAVVMVALSWIGRSWEPSWISYVALGLAYACIIAAFYLDFSKIRKVRRAYQAEMEATKTKEQRAQEKKEKAEQRANRAEAAEKLEAAKAAEAEKESSPKRGLFGFGKKKSE